MTPFDTLALPTDPTVTAPDGSDVRVLLSLPRGSMAHFQLAPGRVSAAVQHRSVEELWFVLQGRAQMWRAQAQPGEGSGQARQVSIVDLVPGLCLSIPVGTGFQFRTVGDEPFAAVAVTMPPWPGPDEAVLIEGPWTAT